MNEILAAVAFFLKTNPLSIALRETPLVKRKPLTPNLDLLVSYNDTKPLYLKRKVQMNQVLLLQETLGEASEWG